MLPACEQKLKEKRALEMKGQTGVEGRVNQLEEALKEVKVERIEPLEREVRALRESTVDNGTARLMPSGSSSSMI